MAIEIENIATNRYAPAGAEYINLYSTELASSLTLGQLSIAVSLRAAAAYEAQSVIKMNTMTADSVKLESASEWLGKIADGSADWAQAKAFCVSSLEIAEDDLPPDLGSYEKRMQAVNAMKNKIDALSQRQQQDMIDLQSMVNRRDVAYSTSSNIIRALGNSMESDAANF